LFRRSDTLAEIFIDLNKSKCGEFQEVWKNID
jgi:hypothetical protein